MIHRTAIAAFAALLFGGVAARASAQVITDSSTVDHIAAVVGTKAILSSEVAEEVFARAGNHQDPTIPDPAKDSSGYVKALRRYVDTLVAYELLYREAAADTTIKVTDQEVQEAVDQLVAQARRNVKVASDFNEQLHAMGFANVEEWRKSLLEKERRQLTVNRFRAHLTEEGTVKSLTPTEKEMRAFYDLHVDQLDALPPMVSLKQIAIAPKPTEASRARAKALADSLVNELRTKGADFATLARQFSMDEVSRADGGNLDWFRRGKMVPEFEAAAFSLAVGQVSNPVESPFGYHIIQVQRVAPGEVQARHILIIPDVDSAAAKAAHDKAIEIADALNKGASFDSLQHLYHDRSEADDLPDVSVPDLQKEHPEYLAAITGVDSAHVSKPFELVNAAHPLRSKWAVLLVVRRVPAGPQPYDDLKERIRTLVGTQLGESQYINDLRSRTYVDIREP